MATKKSFKEDPTEMFISKPQEDAAPASGSEAPAEFVPPVGYKLKPETKSERLQLLVSPRVLNALSVQAKKEGISRNALANRIFWDYLTDKGALKE